MSARIIPLSDIRRERAFATLAADVKPVADQIIAVVARHRLSPVDARKLCDALGDLCLAAMRDR